MGEDLWHLLFKTGILITVKAKERLSLTVIVLLYCQKINVVFLLQSNPFFFGKKKEDHTGLCCWAQPVMFSSAQDEGNFGRGENCAKVASSFTVKSALWHRNLMHSAGPLLGSAEKTWGLSSEIYFLSANGQSKTWHHTLDEVNEAE